MSYFRKSCAINGKQRGKYSTLWLAGNKMKICSEDIMEVNMEMICNELYKDIVNEKTDECLPFPVQSKLLLGLCIIFAFQLKHFINELEIKQSVFQQYDNEGNIQSGYVNEKNTSRAGKKYAGRTRGSGSLNAASRLPPLLQKFKTLEDLTNLSLSVKLPTTSDLNLKKEEANCAPVPSEDNEEETDVLIEEIPCTSLMTPDWPNLCGKVRLEDVNAFFTELGCVHRVASPPQRPEPTPEENLPEPSMMQDLSPPHPMVLLAMSTPEHPVPHAQIQTQSTELQHFTSILFPDNVLPLSPIPMAIDKQPDSHRAPDTAEEENMMVSLQKDKKSLIIIEETIAVEQKYMKQLPPPPTREWEKENIGYESDDIDKYSTLYGMLKRKLKLQKTNKCTDEQSEAMEPEPEEGKTTNAHMSYVEQAINPELIEETRPYEAVTEGASQSDEGENMLTKNVIPEGVHMNTPDQERWDIPQRGGEFGEAKKMERALLNRKEIYKWLERRVRFLMPDEEEKFQTMFPPGKNNRQEAATAFFLLLRMDKNRIVVLKQEPSENGYGSLWIKKIKL